MRYKERNRSGLANGIHLTLLGEIKDFYQELLSKNIDPTEKKKLLHFAFDVDKAHSLKGSSKLSAKYHKIQGAALFYVGKNGEKGKGVLNEEFRKELIKFLNDEISGEVSVDQIKKEILPTIHKLEVVAGVDKKEAATKPADAVQQKEVSDDVLETPITPTVKAQTAIEPLADTQVATRHTREMKTAGAAQAEVKETGYVHAKTVAAMPMPAELEKGEVPQKDKAVREGVPVSPLSDAAKNKDVPEDVQEKLIADRAEKVSNPITAIPEKAHKITPVAAEVISHPESKTETARKEVNLLTWEDITSKINAYDNSKEGFVRTYLFDTTGMATLKREAKYPGNLPLLERGIHFLAGVVKTSVNAFAEVLFGVKGKDAPFPEEKKKTGEVDLDDAKRLKKIIIYRQSKDTDEKTISVLKEIKKDLQPTLENEGMKAPVKGTNTSINEMLQSRRPSAPVEQAKVEIKVSTSDTIVSAKPTQTEASKEKDKGKDQTPPPPSTFTRGS